MFSLQYLNIRRRYLTYIIEISYLSHTRQRCSVRLQAINPGTQYGGMYAPD